MQPLHLLGYYVGVLGGSDALHIYGGGPTLADDVQPGDELVAPPGDDGLTGGVAVRTGIAAALGTPFGVATIPHARVHGVDGRFPFGAGERMTDQELP